MAKKFHKKDKEIRRLQAQHQAAPVLHTDTPRVASTSNNFSDTIAHNTHNQVRRDIIFLGFVVASMFVILLVINWVLHNTALSKLITG